jgi:hypothetical protein
MNLLRRTLTGCLAAALVSTALAGCENKQTGEALTASPQSSNLTPSDQLTNPSPLQPTPIPSPTIFVPGPFIDPNIDLKAPPVDMPFELKIPALKVNAPMLAVGLAANKTMDAPKGDIGDPIWHTAFWYRGGGIPGAVGTATVAAHVNDPLGRPEIFARLQDLKPGDSIIIHMKYTDIDMVFIIDRVQVYSLKESSDPAVLTQIYGAGPVAGTKPQPAPDGLSHLTLITCAGYIVNGEFDHHTVVYATRTK